MRYVQTIVTLLIIVGFTVINGYATTIETEERNLEKINTIEKRTIKLDNSTIEKRTDKLDNSTIEKRTIKLDNSTIIKELSLDQRSELQSLRNIHSEEIKTMREKEISTREIITTRIKHIKAIRDMRRKHRYNILQLRKEQRTPNK